jgi:hypothetical protein
MDLPEKDKHPLAHAQWLKDAMEASKQAAEHAKSYPELDCREWEVPRDERAIAFHENNSSPSNYGLQDAIMNAMRWHTPPDQMREVETLIQMRDIQRELDRKKHEVEEAKIQIAIWRDTANALIKGNAVLDGDDYEDGDD